MINKHKKTSRSLNYIDRSLIYFFAVTGCVSICAFVSLVGIPIGITSFAGQFKICPITAGIKKYKSITKKKKKKHDKIIFLAKIKLNTMEVLTLSEQGLAN